MQNVLPVVPATKRCLPINTKLIISTKGIEHPPVLILLDLLLYYLNFINYWNILLDQRFGIAIYFGNVTFRGFIQIDFIITIPFRNHTLPDSARFCKNQREAGSLQYTIFHQCMEFFPIDLPKTLIKSISFVILRVNLRMTSIFMKNYRKRSLWLLCLVCNHLGKALHFQG